MTTTTTNSPAAAGASVVLSAAVAAETPTGAVPPTETASTAGSPATSPESVLTNPGAASEAEETTGGIIGIIGTSETIGTLGIIETAGIIGIAETLGIGGCRGLYGSKWGLGRAEGRGRVSRIVHGGRARIVNGAGIVSQEVHGGRLSSMILLFIHKQTLIVLGGRMMKVRKSIRIAAGVIIKLMSGASRSRMKAVILAGVKSRA